MVGSTSQTLDLPFDRSRTEEQLSRTLEVKIGAPVQVVYTSNRVSMVHFRWEGGVVRLRVHEAMADMPDDVLDALAGWIRKPGRRGAPAPVRRYIRDLPTGEDRRTKRPLPPPRPRGAVYDLGTIAREVNARFFGNRVTASITWGRDTSTTAVRSRRLGSYRRDGHRIIIHPVLDSPHVPVEVVAFTVFHEMLHALQPADQKRHHDKAFREAERAHPDYTEVQAWLKKHTRLINGGRRR